MKKTPETLVKKEIKDWFDLYGWEYFANLQGLGSYPGLSDFIAFHYGVVLFVEVKAKNGKQSPKQKEFEAKVKAQNCHYILARGYEDIENYLQQIKEK